MLTVTFHGVRGSTPCPCDANHRYGGNTSCVALESPGRAPIIFDLGTGLRQFGHTVEDMIPFRGTALVTHIHWDHIQGLPFFVPALHPDAELDIYAPSPKGQSLADCFGQFVAPPYFPVHVNDLPGTIRFHELDAEEFVVGDAKVMARPVPHVGATNGYRVTIDDVTVVYISDHQMPADGSHAVTDGVLELCADADLLIHDAQYTPDEFVRKSDWGHCTVEFAVRVAEAANVKKLALFHHDPAHDDAKVDSMLAEAKLLADPSLEIIAASEGLTVVL